MSSPAESAAETPAGTAAGKGRFLLLSLAVLAADQWTKWMVDLHLPEHAVEAVIPGLLNLTHVRNTGVAFGLFAAAGRGAGTWLLTALGLAALGLVGLYFWRVPRHNRLLQAALALVLGGAVGNLIDRVAAGAVTDFIDVYVGTYHWHTFNVADSAISVGIAFIAWDTLVAHRRAASSGQASTDPA
jgi:signal peptidase II